MFSKRTRLRYAPALFEVREILVVEQIVLFVFHFQVASYINEIICVSIRTKFNFSRLPILLMDVLLDTVISSTKSAAWKRDGNVDIFLSRITLSNDSLVPCKFDVLFTLLNCSLKVKNVIG